jgi:hypothetical protein
MLHPLAELLAEVRVNVAKVSGSFSGMLAKISGSKRKCLQKLAKAIRLANSGMTKVKN